MEEKKEEKKPIISEDSLIDIPVFQVWFLVFIMLSSILFLFLFQCSSGKIERGEIVRGSIVTIKEDYHSPSGSLLFEKGSCGVVLKTNTLTTKVASFSHPLFSRSIGNEVLSVVGGPSSIQVVLWNMRFIFFFLLLAGIVLFARRALGYRREVYRMFFSPVLEKQIIDVPQKTQKDTPEFHNEYQDIRRLFFSERKEDNVLGIIRADTLLENILKERGVVGDTAGEVFTNASVYISNVQEIWNAHKVRNEIVHGKTDTIAEQDIQGSIKILNRAIAKLLDIQHGEDALPQKKEEYKPFDPPTNLPL